MELSVGAIKIHLGKSDNIVERALLVELLKRNKIIRSINIEGGEESTVIEISGQRLGDMHDLLGVIREEAERTKIAWRELKKSLRLKKRK